MEQPKENFVIIDSNSVIHRAFHALPPLTRSDGKVVNAVYGFLLVLFKLFKELQPKYLAACFDVPAPTFRKQAFAAYKAQRKKAPDELYEQIPMVKDVLRAFNISVFEMAGYEGDDIIGTIAADNTKKGIHSIVVSGDTDNLQLVDPNTEVYFLSQGVKQAIIYNEDKVKEKYGGLSPFELVELKGLKGDASDNIPGVKGIGEKTAEKLVHEYGTIDNLYNHLEDADLPSSLKEKLTTGREQALLSRHLSEIRRDVPLTEDLSSCRWDGYDHEQAAETLKSFGFSSLLKNIPGQEGKTVGQNLKLW